MIFFRPGGFGARDYRNPTQLRGGRGGGNRSAGTGNSFNNNHQPWDSSNGGGLWSNDHQSGGYDRFSQSQSAGGNGNRGQDTSWWDSTS